MDEIGSGGAEALGEIEEGGVVFEGGGVEAEVGFDEVFEEVFLFPAVERGVEGRLEVEVAWGPSVEEFVELFKGGAVKGFAFGEGGVFEAEEVLVAEVFDECDLAADIIVEHAGNVEAGFGEEFGDGEEVGVVGAFEGVVNADE